MKTYLLLMSTDDGPRSAEITVPDVLPIARAQSWTNTQNKDGFLYPDSDNYLWAQGLRLIGDLDQKLYVDDYPKFANYRLQAEYSDGAVKEVPLRADTSWEIRPRYNNGPDKTGMGDLLLTIGKNPLIVYENDGTTIKSKQHPYVQAALDSIKFSDGTGGGTADNVLTGAPTATLTFDAGITMKHPYEEVWHVRSVKLVDEPGLDYFKFFYWDDDGAKAWTDRLIAKDASIVVTYTNDATKTFKVDAATRMNDVWYNEVPGFAEVGKYTPFAVKGVQASSPASATYPNGSPHARNRDPRVTLYYRGATYDFQVPVYTRLQGITAARKDGADATEIDMRFRDNDVGGTTATSFAGLLNVTADFTAYMNSDLHADLLLTFKEGYFNHLTDLADDGQRSGYTRGVPVRFNDSDTANLPPDAATAKGVDLTINKTSKDATTFYGDTITVAADAAKVITFKRNLAGAYSMSFGKPSYWDTSVTADVQPDHPNWNDDYDSPGTDSITNIKARVPNWDGISDVGVKAFGLCDTPRNNGREVAVVLYYTPPVGIGGVDSASTRNARFTVTWQNIHVR